jgi:hypothetical protein
MNKTYTFAFALVAHFLLAITAKSQTRTIDEETKLITYTEVIEIPSVSKDELFNRSKMWISRAFRSSKAVTDLEDKEGGKIIAKGNISTTIKMPLSPRLDAGAVSMTVTLLLKDGKYKYVVDNFQHSAPIGTPGTWISVGPLEQEKAKAGMMSRPSNPEWRELKEDAFKTIESMIADLKKAMQKSEKDF